MELQPCASCRRHVAETTCPFCGHAVDVVQRDHPLGRLSRAAVFGAATLVACGGYKPPKKDPDQVKLEEQQERQRRRPPCSTPDAAELERLQKRRDEAPNDEERRAVEREIEIAKTPVCAPYGAPPARRRVV